MGRGIRDTSRFWPKDDMDDEQDDESESEADSDEDGAEQEARAKRKARSQGVDEEALAAQHVAVEEYKDWSKEPFDVIVAEGYAKRREVRAKWIEEIKEQ